MADMENHEAKKLKMTMEEGNTMMDLDGDVIMFPHEKTSTSRSLIYFCSLETDRTLNWYALNPNTGNCNIIPEISSRENTVLPVDYGSAIFNSKIYIVGGRPATPKSSPINDVQVFDPITKELHTVDSMSCARAVPAVVPIEGFGIYVFGGLSVSDCNLVSKKDGCQPWGEFYDGNKWHQLPTEPPSEITRIRTLSGHAVYGVDIIILWNEVLCCLYNITQSSWHFLELPIPDDPYTLSFGRFLSCTKNVAVVDDKLYWCFGNLFAFPLNRINDDYIDNTVYKFEQSDSPTTAPSIFSCKECLLPHSVVPFGKEQLCVVWFNLVDIENGITVSWNNFQIRKQSRSTGESKDVHVFPIGGLHTTKVDGFRIFQFPGLLEHNDVQGSHDFQRFYEKPKDDPLELLENLCQSMFLHNYNSLQQSRKVSAFAEVVDGHIYRIDRSLPEITKPQLKSRSELQTWIELPHFLEQLNLSKYLQIFDQEKVSMVGLKYFSDEDFNALNIPLGARNKIVHALHTVKFVK